MGDTPDFTAPQPGAEHAVFTKDVGTWDAEVVVTPGPGQPPQQSRGVAVNRLVAGGRWLLSDFRNETTGFEGHGVYGWDAGLAAYVGTWVDNLRSSLVIAQGSYDETTRTMTMRSQLDGPGGKSLLLREVTETIDADTQVFRSFLGLPDGGEFELMMVTYRRRRTV